MVGTMQCTIEKDEMMLGCWGISENWLSLGPKRLMWIVAWIDYDQTHETFWWHNNIDHLEPINNIITSMTKLCDDFTTSATLKIQFATTVKTRVRQCLKIWEWVWLMFTCLDQLIHTNITPWNHQKMSTYNVRQLTCVKTKFAKMQMTVAICEWQWK